MRRLVALAMAAWLAVGCSSLDQSRDEAVRKSENRRPYVAQNDVEFKNYDRRQRLADDPSTILWCTSAFPVTGSPLITVPIVGKLTSGSKRPYQENSSAEAIGPDGMYGGSVPYRYGFTPEGVYVDLTDIATFCTTQPSVWQRESTTLVLATDDALAAATAAASEAIRAGDPAKAQQILEEAIAKAGGK